MEQKKNNQPEEVLGIQPQDSGEVMMSAPEEKTSFKERSGRAKRLRYHSFLTISVAVALAIAVGVNLICSILVDKYNLNLDFTSDSAFSLSAESKEYASSVEIPVEVFVLAKQTDWETSDTYAQVLNMLRSFTAINDKISLTFKDLDENPTFAKDFPDLELASNDLLFKSPFRTRRISGADLAPYLDVEQTQIAYQYGNTEAVYSSKAENLITGSLYSVCVKTQPIVQLVSGHGEEAALFEKLTYQLELSGYTVKTVNTLTHSLDPSAQFVLIGSPAKDWTSNELKMLDTFLNTQDDSSKSVIYFADCSRPAPTNLNRFLNEWGIQIEDSGFAVETDTNKLYQDQFPLLTLHHTDTSGDFNNEFKNSLLISTYAVPMSMKFKENGYTKVQTLLSLSAGKLMADEKNEATNQPEEFPVAILSERVTFESSDLDRPGSNVMVFGAPIHASQFFEAEVFSNGDYIVNAMNVMLAKEERLNISTRTVSTHTLTANVGQVIIMLVVFAGVIPLTALIIGFIIWLRRRSL